MFALNRCRLSPPPLSTFQEDLANGKTTNWPELEITGTIRNLSPELWKLEHLTALYINDNCLFRWVGRRGKEGKKGCFNLARTQPISLA